MSADKPVTLDEDLHSRQIAVYGRHAMGKLSTSSVLVSGLNGLGVEICKNVILAGCKRVALHDTAAATCADLSSNFYITAQDLGKNRAAACEHRLQELNPAVHVETHGLDAPLTPALLEGFQVVVVVGGSLEAAAALDAHCRAQSPPVAFIRTEVNGLLGSVFTDFGPAFTVHDTTGEEVKTAILSSVTQAEDGLVTCVDEERIDFEDGDLVTFSEVSGMAELNTKGPFKVANVKPYSFTIGDTRAFGAYKGHGVVTEVKQPKELAFKSLTDALAAPGEFLESDYSKFGRPALLHLVARALDAYRARHGGGALPQNNDPVAVDQVLAIAKELAAGNDAVDLGDEANCKVVAAAARVARTVLNPMAAVFGGIVGQEVIKALTQKFHPIHQFFYMDFLECLADDAPVMTDAQYAAAPDSRYADQIAVFGKAFQEKVGNLNYFLVGAGALGCEFIKNFAMMGLACGPKGKLTVTDDDTIEKSNLSRQFLFRNWMIGKSKSQAAADSVASMNDAIKITALQDRVAPNTEDVFNTAFWQSLDGVCNALDNVKARLYVDSRCVFFEKSLLESGTLGTKCNTQVVLPHKTENYGASRDPPEKQAPDCTLHNFPHNINHCLTWARSEFIGHFDTAPTDAVDYLEAADFVKGLKDAFAGEHDIVEKLQNVKTVTSAPPASFQDCVAWARITFEDYFANRVKQLVHSFPRDATTNTGLPFWTPPKRFPTPVVFDPKDAAHMAFIMAAANMRAKVYGVAAAVPEADRRSSAYLAECVAKVAVPDFVPKSNVKIETDSSRPTTSTGAPAAADDEDLDQQIARLAAELPKASAVKGKLALAPEEFEKDDDTNFHMDFIAAAGNLRARCYGIGEIDKLKAKFIAGRIIPAIATTTAFATGLVCLELYKLVQGKDMEAFRNTFANLALPLFSMMEPMPPQKVKSRTERNVPDPLNHPEYVEEEEIVAQPEGFTAWDRIDVRLGNATLKQYLDFFESELKLTCTDISVMTSDNRGVCLYRDTALKAAKDRMDMTLTDLIEKVAKDSVPGPYVIPTVGFENDDGVVVETPTIVFWL